MAILTSRLLSCGRKEDIKEIISSVRNRKVQDAQEYISGVAHLVYGLRKVCEEETF